MFLASEDEPRGAHLENMILADVLAWSGAQIDAPAVHYWRTASGDEVDFVVVRGRQILPVEVKATTRVRLEDARGLLAFQDEYGRRTRAGLLLHGGDRVEWLADRVLAAPWWAVV